MKPLLLAAAMAVQVLPLFGQGGPLTPPGAPGPTYKSLDEVEPRVPLIAGAPGVSVAGSGTISIGAPGSYYLTKNLTVTTGSGIIIGANGVTVDLRGFTISSTAATATAFGINIIGSNVAISNGHIVSGTTFTGGGGDQFTGSGFSHGIYAGTDSYKNLRVRDVAVQGCDLNGIYCAELASTIVEFCTVRTAGGIGVRAGTLRDCAASECGGTAIEGTTIANCRGESVGNEGIAGANVSNSYGSTTSTSASAVGVLASFTAENCFGQSSGGEGIQAGNVVNCQGVAFSTAAGADGIEASYTVQGSTGSSFGGDGINCFGSVANSHGTTSSGSSSARGIDAGQNVHNSFGQSASSDGIRAANVGDSYGITTSGNAASDGIEALYTVHNSFGQTTLGGNGIRAANVSNSYGTTLSTHADADGIEATHTVRGSYGKGSGGAGILAFQGTVEGSYGESSNADGVQASEVSHSSGVSTALAVAADGIEAQRTVANCYGQSNVGYGIKSFGTVANSYGFSASDSTSLGGPGGINALISVHNSYGRCSSSGDGIHSEIVSYSKGERASSGGTSVGLRATIAVGCTFVNGSNITNKYLMP